MYDVYELGAVGCPAEFMDYHLGAIGEEVTIYPTEEDWRSVHTPLNLSDSTLSELDPAASSEIYLGPEFVASNWLFALYTGDASADDPNLNSISVFKAVANSVEVVTNELTGMQWYKVEADCSVPVTVALPIDITPAPQAGCVIDGNAFLTGTTGGWQRGAS